MTAKSHRESHTSRVKKQISESLAESHAYYPIQDSGETLGEREKSLQESWRESHQESSRDPLETLAETFGETLGETFRARQASPQSLGSDYIHGSPQDSLRDSFFLRGFLSVLTSIYSSPVIISSVDYIWDAVTKTHSFQISIYHLYKN